ncbi:hypothetical protein MTP10_19370 [Nonomuraea sp. 3-1Str]|uniref:hypothetical protein n=1 Tax=Nonomuraea sp. 3-1Str TaxID=2929801 RepID=UPI002854B86F|nr:hypothetical protein [Nonomuraea sp. 3-1Str]MDR8410884.1 hypothetical protein [Nonomuraea sp. 3-1Str]
MTPHALPPRLVIDPSLPRDVWARLWSAPHLLRMARTGTEPASARGQVALILLTVVTLLAVLVVRLPGGPIVAAVAAAGLGTIALTRELSVAADRRDLRRRGRLARQYAAHYVLPEDLDYPCQRLLRRAQDAVDAVLCSAVHRAGLIDTIDNQVTLPEEVWQIAHRLSRLSAMHAEHRKVVPRVLPSGLEDAFRPYTTALDAAWTSLSKRVRHLEQYARQVSRADQVFHAQQRLETLAARTPDYQRLVADTVRDDLARRHIRELEEQARQVRRLFEESVLQARRTAGELLRTPLT